MTGFVRVTIGTSEHMGTIKSSINDNKDIIEVRKAAIVSYYTNKGKIWTLKNLFKEVANILNYHEFVFWLDSGTLLGIHRHKGIIPWDDDIDIGMFYEDIDKLLSLTSIFTDNGIRMQLNRTKCYYQFDFIHM